MALVKFYTIFFLSASVPFLAFVISLAFRRGSWQFKSFFIDKKFNTNSQEGRSQKNNIFQLKFKEVRNQPHIEFKFLLLAEPRKIQLKKKLFSTKQVLNYSFCRGQLNPPPFQYHVFGVDTKDVYKDQFYEEFSQEQFSFENVFVHKIVPENFKKNKQEGEGVKSDHPEKYLGNGADGTISKTLRSLSSTISRKSTCQVIFYINFVTEIDYFYFIIIRLRTRKGVGNTMSNAYIFFHQPN